MQAGGWTGAVSTGMAFSALKKFGLASRRALRPDVKRARKPLRGTISKLSARLSHLTFVGLLLVAATPGVRGNFEVVQESKPRRVTLYAEPLPALPQSVAEAQGPQSAREDRAPDDVLKDTGASTATVAADVNKIVRARERSPIVPPVKRERPTELTLAAAASIRVDQSEGAPARAKELAALHAPSNFKALKRVTAHKVRLPEDVVKTDAAPAIVLASLSDAIPVALETPPQRMLRVRQRGRDRPAKAGSAAQAAKSEEPAIKVAALPGAPTPESTRPIASVSKGAVYTVVPSWTARDIADAKRVCGNVLTGRRVVANAAQPMREGSCGAPAPLSVRKIGEPGVELHPSAMLTCPMAAALDRWMSEVVQPAALETFGAPVVKLVAMSSYSCRNRYGRTEAPISEHALVNAVDLEGFVLRDGRTIKVLTGWGQVVRDGPVPSEDQAAEVKIAEAKPAFEKDSGASMLGAGSLAKPGGRGAKAAEAEADAEAATDKSGGAKLAGKQGGEQGTASREDAKDATSKTPDKVAKAEEAEPSEEEKRSTFLHKVHAEACALFGTVLGPEANDAHRNHFHLDMKARRGPHGYCQ